MKFLILLVLIPFLALAESGVTNSFKIAGNSTTSKNLVNGSFESGANTGWTVGAGTLTATTAERVQGLNSGLWSVTGAGTIDLCATPTNLASTDLIASGWVKSTSPDLQVCSVINSVENGCTALGTITGWKKVTASGTYSSGNFCFRLKSVASGAITAYVDDVKVEPLEFQQVSTVDNESIVMTGYTSKDGSAYVKFKTIETTQSDYGDVVKIDNTTYPNQTRFTVLQKANVQLSTSINFSTAAVTVTIIHFNSTGTVLKKSEPTHASSTYNLTAPMVTLANAGDYFVVYTDTTPVDDTKTNFSITATAVRDNVIQSYQDGGVNSTAFTPTITSGSGAVSNATSTAYYLRQGEKLKVFGTIAFSGASSAFSELFVSIPNGLTIDTSKYGSSALTVYGSSNFIDAGIGYYPGQVMGSGGNSTVRLRYIVSASTSPTNLSVVSNTLPFTYGAGDFINYEYEVSIVGWSSLPALIALPTRSEVFSANVSIAGAVTNATQNFVTSCTNAAPSVCTLWSNFGVTPICWSHPVDITKRAEVTTTSTTSLTVGRTDTSTAFNLFCHLK